MNSTIDNSFDLPSPMDILDGKVTKMPNKENLSAAYITIIALGNELKILYDRHGEGKEFIDAAGIYYDFLMSNFSPEFCVIGNRQCLKDLNLPMTKAPNWKEFAHKNARVVFDINENNKLTGIASFNDKIEADDILDGKITKKLDNMISSYDYTMTMALSYQLYTRYKKYGEQKEYISSLENYFDFMMNNFCPEFCIMGLRDCFKNYDLPMMNASNWKEFADKYRDIIKIA